jgi:RHS repeat-associated protein
MKMYSGVLSTCIDRCPFPLKRKARSQCSPRIVRRGWVWGRSRSSLPFLSMSRARSRERGLGGGRSVLAILLLALISTAFSPATTGCSGGPGAAEPSLSASQKATVYYIDDHLGSAQLMTDGEGHVVYEGVTAPYGLDLDGLASAENGDESAEETGVDYSYTTKERDEETGLVYFGKRYYAPDMGRWISPDPLYLETPSKIVEQVPQQNLYSYTMGNPVNYRDPDGRDVFYFGVNTVGWIAVHPMEPSKAAVGVNVEYGMALNVKSYEIHNLFNLDNYELTRYFSLGKYDYADNATGVDLSAGGTIGYLGVDTSFDDLSGKTVEHIGSILSIGFSETVTESDRHGVSLSLGAGGGLGTMTFENTTEIDVDMMGKMENHINSLFDADKLSLFEERGPHELSL